jgi:hypothetical protein
VEGASSRSKVAASKTRLATNKAPGKARSRKGQRRWSQKAVSETVTRDETSPQTGEPSLGINAGIVQTREARRGATVGTLAVGCREESSAHAEAPALRRAFSRRA